MSSKTNKNHEVIVNTMWQRNLGMARDIRISLSKLFNGSFGIIEHILNQYVEYNDTDSVGLLLSLLVSIGHFADNSSVNITNHSSNLNLFLLLVGPSGTVHNRDLT